MQTESTRTVEQEAEKSAGILSILATKDFVFLYLISFCQIYYGYYILGSYKTIGSAYIRDD